LNRKKGWYLLPCWIEGFSLHSYPAAINASSFVGVNGEVGLFASRLGEERAGL
jgi:hypothetical protein